MQASNKSGQTIPVLPALISFPLKCIPDFVHNRFLVTSLNKIFSHELAEGELDFLQQKIVHISIEDAGINLCFSLNNNKIVTVNNKISADLCLQGTVYNYLRLASRQEDSDALFFSRRLHMQGDTELGLYVKNFLDGLDMDSHKASAYVELFLQKSLPLYERLFR